MKRNLIEQKLLVYRRFLVFSTAVLLMGIMLVGFTRAPKISGEVAPRFENGLDARMKTATADTAEYGTTGDTLLASAAPIQPETLHSEPAEEVEVSHVLEEGRASYYGDELAGRPTASGERFDPSQLTAAHPNLPFGTRLRVTSLRTGKSVIVRINDRGPFTGQRVIDLSYAAAKTIGMVRRGTARVRMEVLK